MRLYTVYMLASQTRVLYIGVTSDLTGRTWQHQHDLVHSFSSRYRVHSLVWYECHEDPTAAILREKQLKRWSRKKKIWLIERMNPGWKDLSLEL